MCRRGEAGELKNVKVHHLHTEGPAPYTDPKFEGIFFHQGFFIGANVRKSVQEGYSDYIQVCPPDKHGYVSLGTSVDATLAAIECAKTVIAVVNPNVPRAWGQAMIPADLIDIFVEDDTPLVPSHFSQPDEVETAIGKHCAELIEDGSCLQMGIGAIPNAVLAQLGGHKHLGIHTEMFADGVLGLVDKGVIDGTEKVTDKGKIVATFLLGSKECYNFIDDNPMVAMMDVGYTNDPYVISKNPKMVAINSAVQIDLTGQICADSIGTKFYSGVGGQVTGRESHHSHAVTHEKRSVEDISCHHERSRSSDHKSTCALGRYRIRSRGSLRKINAGKSETAHKHRPSGRP